MRAVVQRVRSASVHIGEHLQASIGRGLLVLVGIQADDGEKDIDYIVNKCLAMRIFDDDKGDLNLSASALGLPCLVISQFTLYADARRGRRPSFTRAASPAAARPIYERLCERFSSVGPSAEFGVFGADMQVSLVNDGPVTILLDSRKEF